MKIEFDTKEQLETKYKEWKKKFENQGWTIEKYAFGDIMLCKNGKFVKQLLSHWDETVVFNLNNLAWNMAEAMGDLMDTKDRLDPAIIGYSFYFDCEDIDFYNDGNYYDLNINIFKTKEIMLEALKLLINSQVIKDYINEMKEGK